MTGNVNFARAREGLMKSELLGAELEQCFPLMELDAFSVAALLCTSCHS